MSQITKKAAHFLMMPEVVYSPSNEVIIHALLDSGYEVDVYAPGKMPEISAYGNKVKAKCYEYGRRWLVTNLLSISWRQYSIFSANAEAPFAIVGLLSFLHQRKLFLAVDEIKSGSYWGNDPLYMKRLHQWAIHRAKLCIVNDESRVKILKQYVNNIDENRIIVQPNCYRELPKPMQRQTLRNLWNIPQDALTIGASGVYNELSGAEWLLNAFSNIKDMHLLMQPVGISPLSQLLLQYIEGKERLFLRTEHLGWRGAWSTVPAVDIGLAIYLNPGPQFQNMGVSSNRLCMYLSMGVPVIASKQDSFKFLEEYDCGVMVESSDEFIAAINYIRNRLPEMKQNALRCAKEYIDVSGRYQNLLTHIVNL